jgi:hypothetical protein
MIDTTQSQKSEPQLGSQHGGKRTLFWSLDPNRLHACRVRILADLIEQDGFSYAPKPDH